MSACLDHYLSERELVIEGVIGRNVISGPCATRRRISSAGIIFLLMSSFARCGANSISRRGVFWVFW
jgi:hypothetical protein